MRGPTGGGEESGATRCHGAYAITDACKSAAKASGSVQDLVFRDAHDAVAGHAEAPIALAVLAEAPLRAVGLPIVELAR